MTREEAIEYLNTLYMALAVFPNQQISLGNVDEMKESVSMAIEALKKNESAEEWYKLFVEKLEKEPTDAISRQDALDCLTANGLKKFDFILDARDKIKNLPSVRPQEPILDKIRAEIEALIEWHDCPIEYDNGNDAWYCEACNQAIKIIDKYRGESDCRECKVEHDCYECKKYTESEES